MNPAVCLCIALLLLSLPALAQRGKDGYACVHCHAWRAIFHVTWGTVMPAVRTDAPQNGLILLKPTSTAESEGVAGAGTVAKGEASASPGTRRNTSSSWSGSKALERIKGPGVDQEPGGIA